MIFRIYPSTIILIWLGIALVGIITNLILLAVAEQSRVYAKPEGGQLYELAIFKFARMCIRMGIHTSNLLLGLSGLLTPPRPQVVSHDPTVALLAEITVFALFTAHILVVVDGGVELISVARALRSDE